MASHTTQVDADIPACCSTQTVSLAAGQVGKESLPTQQERVIVARRCVKAKPSGRCATCDALGLAACVPWSIGIERRVWEDGG